MGWSLNSLYQGFLWGKWWIHYQSLYPYNWDHSSLTFPFFFVDITFKFISISGLLPTKKDQSMGLWEPINTSSTPSELWGRHGKQFLSLWWSSAHNSLFPTNYFYILKFFLTIAWAFHLFFKYVSPPHYHYHLVSALKLPNPQPTFWIWTSHRGLLWIYIGINSSCADLSHAWIHLWQTAWNSKGQMNVGSLDLHFKGRWLARVHRL